MLFGIYAVYDETAATYLPPFFLPNDAMAQRSFADAVMDEKHAFSKNIQDYTLFKLGQWESDSGDFEYVAPQMMQTALQCRAAVNRRQMQLFQTQEDTTDA
jgi:hypothetical protein